MVDNQATLIELVQVIEFDMRREREILVTGQQRSRCILVLKTVVGALPEIGIRLCLYGYLLCLQFVTGWSVYPASIGEIQFHGSMCLLPRLILDYNQSGSEAFHRCTYPALLTVFFS